MYLLHVMEIDCKLNELIIIEMKRANIVKGSSVYSNEYIYCYCKTLHQ